MVIIPSILLLLLSPVFSKPRYIDVDDEEDQLFRAAFDTPIYEIDEAEDDLQLGKKDLLKDSIWAVKAKLKELKALSKALAANLMLTNMKVKELLENQIAIKTHQHNILDKKFYFHNYQLKWTCPYQYSKINQLCKWKLFRNEMRINFIWIIILILPYILVTSQPVPGLDSQYVNHNVGSTNVHPHIPNAQSIPKQGDPSNNDEQIISVRITSSVAVGRTKPRAFKILDKSKNLMNHDIRITTPIIEVSQSYVSTTDVDDVTTTFPTTILEEAERVTDIPPNLVGANIEYINQLKAKKGTRGLSSYERLHSFGSNGYLNFNETNDSVAESSISDQDDIVDEVPLARSVPLSYYKNNIPENIPGRGNTRLTSVNFNVVHENQKASKYNDRLSSYMNQNIGDQKFYNEPSKVYSQPSQVYSEPAKFYSEPAKIYSEPAKIYSEPAKIYSEPAKIYSEPAKFYSQPASLHLSPETTQEHRPWPSQKETSFSTTVSTTPIASVTGSYKQNVQRMAEQEPEKNYEIDEKVSVITDGRSHGEQSGDIENNPENCKQENCKVGYVVEGRQFRKYRVEERTPDGFIVGEYGVVRNEDGALRGVRYTADSDASPRLIHDALMKFLQLK